MKRPLSSKVTCTPDLLIFSPIFETENVRVERVIPSGSRRMPWWGTLEVFSGVSFIALWIFHSLTGFYLSCRFDTGFFFNFVHCWQLQISKAQTKYYEVLLRFAKSQIDIFSWHITFRHWSKYPITFEQGRRVSYYSKIKLENKTDLICLPLRVKMWQHFRDPWSALIR